MNPAELPLRDIHLPPPPGWWPPAPGWWAVLAIIVIAGVFLAWWSRRAGRRRSAVAQARLELARLRADLATTPTHLAAELSALLRRVCISLYPRRQVAGLTGAGWLQFLDDIRGGREFCEGPGRILIQAPYRPGVARAELDPVLDLCATWLEAASRHLAGGKHDPV